MDALVDRTLSVTTKRRQWTLVALLVAAGVVNFLDRSTLSIANKPIVEEMHLSDGEIGFLISAFAWAYGLAQLPAGSLSDRFGPHIVLSAAMAVWSVAQIVCGAVQTFAQFIVARVILGLGESPMFTAGARATVDWYPLRDRGVPLGLFNSASSLGPALAPLPLTALMLAFGWRWMLVVMGALGLLVAFAWWWHYRDPEAAGIPAEDLAAIRAGDVVSDVKAGPRMWAAFFAVPSTWALMGGLFGSVYITWLYVAWLPRYLEDVRGVSIAHTGLLATIPQLAGFAGGVAGGYFSDWLAHRDMDPVLSRKIPTVVGLVIAGLVTFVAHLPADLNATLALMSAAMFFAYGSGSCSWALGASLTPPHLVATVEAIQNIGGSFGGALAPLVTGLVVQHVGSYGPAFTVAAVAALASAVSYALVRPDAYRGIGQAA